MRLRFGGGGLNRLERYVPLSRTVLHAFRSVPLTVCTAQTALGTYQSGLSSTYQERSVPHACGLYHSWYVPLASGLYHCGSEKNEENIRSVMLYRMLKEFLKISEFKIFCVRYITYMSFWNLGVVKK